MADMTLPDFMERFQWFATFLFNAILCAFAAKAYQETRKRPLLLLAIAAAMGAGLTLLCWAEGDRSSSFLRYFSSVATMAPLGLGLVGCRLLFRDYADLLSRTTRPPVAGGGGPAAPVDNAEVARGNAPGEPELSGQSQMPLESPPPLPQLPPSPRAPLSRRSKLLLGLTVASGVVMGMLIVLRVCGLVRPFFVPTGSMAPAVSSGDHVMTEGLTFLVRQPRRGEIVAFRTDGIPRLPFGTFYVERVVGEPGDRVRIANGKLFIDEK